MRSCASASGSSAAEFYRGKTVRIGPVPQTKPHPPLWYGGMSKAAARRAARFGLPFYPPAQMPDLINTYNEELVRLGKIGSVDWPREGTSLEIGRAHV